MEDSAPWTKYGMTKHQYKSMLAKYYKYIAESYIAYYDSVINQLHETHVHDAYDKLTKKYMLHEAKYYKKYFNRMFRYYEYLSN